MVSDNERWLSESELEAWITISALLEVYPAAIEAQLKRDLGINRFEYTIMAMLSEHDRPLVMSELARIAFGSLSRLSHAITRLETRGWVERQAGSGGRRHNTVSLTEQGRDAIEVAAPRHVAVVRGLLVEPLDAEELALLTAVGRKLIRAADPVLDENLDRLVPEIIARNQSNGR